MSALVNQVPTLRLPNETFSALLVFRVYEGSVPRPSCLRITVTTLDGEYEFEFEACNTVRRCHSFSEVNVAFICSA